MKKITVGLIGIFVSRKEGNCMEIGNCGRRDNVDGLIEELRTRQRLNLNAPLQLASFLFYFILFIDIFEKLAPTTS